MEEEYELVPIGPIRRLEKKIEQMENTGGGESTKALVEVVKSNQTIVDEMIKVNSDLVDRVAKLMESVNSLNENLTDFMQKLEIASETDIEESGKKSDENSAKVNEKLAKLEKRLNALILTTMPNMKFKRGR
ncbi:MAG: hypothetical protein HY364_05100 [Candidatus Aenigmarchaeota archaeon]|nr:hypothetical protein [Candidatus Aenigmarchaeota archaeon]